ncbi:MAG: class C beta-lactamase-related serine hydrolase, partial [Halomonadaceae bacterium]
LHSVLVSVEGELVLAQVFGGPGVDQPANIKSLSKTVLSAVVGAAIDRGVIPGSEQPIAGMLPVPPQANPRVNDITIGHLLAMQSGLSRTSGEAYVDWVNSDNWVHYVLSRPFEAEPGEGMLYSTGSSHLLSALLTRLTGRSTLDLTREWLGNALNIMIHPWHKDPQGIYFGGNDMFLSPLALLHIGELYRNQGRHRDHQVLSPDWIEESWQGRGHSPYSGDAYGYGWFITELSGHQTYYGRGFGGQMLYVIPSLAMTVVMTADPLPPSDPDYMHKQHRLITQWLIPAISEK